MRSEDKERIQVEVVSRVVEGHVQRARSAAPGYLEHLVNDTLYHERLRLETENPDQPRIKADLAMYRPMRSRMRHASPSDLQAMLQEITRHLVEEVTGHFDPRVYRVATRVVPPGLSLLLNAMSPTRLASLKDLRTTVADHVELRGDIEQIRRLSRRGTLIVVPTHSSNLDSILLGYAWHLIGMPPLCYGAGLNLFHNRMLSFFMHNLGAYKVDRKKKAGLYKELLKQYATCSIEMGYHNLFFPGGTRSRSGAVESKLKKGLLGTSVSAYVNNLRNRNPKPDIFIIPTTLSYKLVLEAETLIDDHLKAVGKSRYIIEDDEFSKPRRILDFFRDLIALDGKIGVTFSPALDVFGNRVDDEGNSLDPRGRPVDPRRYVMRDGEPVHDAQRDAQYTRDMEPELVDAFHRDSVLMSTNVVGHALFRMLDQANPGMDPYRLLRTGGEKPSFPMADLHRETGRVLGALKEARTPPRFGDELQGSDVQAIVADALKHFAIYHEQPAAERRGDRVFHLNRRLLLYYGNRLRGYDLGRVLAA